MQEEKEYTLETARMEIRRLQHTQEFLLSEVLDAQTRLATRQMKVGGVMGTAANAERDLQRFLKTWEVVPTAVGSMGEGVMVVTYTSISDRARASQAIADASMRGSILGIWCAKLLPKHVRMQDLPVKHMMDVVAALDSTSDLHPMWKTSSARNASGEARIYVEWHGITQAKVYIAGIEEAALQVVATEAHSQWRMKAKVERERTEMKDKDVKTRARASGATWSTRTRS